MPLPSVEEAYVELTKYVHAKTGATVVGLPYHVAVLQAAAEVQLAKRIQESGDVVISNGMRAAENLQRTLKESTDKVSSAVDRFTTASDLAADKLGNWTKQTADATDSLKKATWLLLVVALIQALAAVGQVVVVLMKP